jgi:hypothetical protein
MSANIRMDIERLSALGAPGGHGIRETAKKRLAPRDFWERECGARRSYERGWCRSTVLGPLGRCRMHGGWNFGPRTPEGKARSLAALARINAERAAARPEAVIRRLAAEGCSLAEIAESVPAWIIPRIRAFLIAEERNHG